MCPLMSTKQTFCYVVMRILLRFNYRRKLVSTGIYFLSQSNQEKLQSIHYIISIDFLCRGIETDENNLSMLIVSDIYEDEKIGEEENSATENNSKRLKSYYRVISSQQVSLLYLIIVYMKLLLAKVTEPQVFHKM